MLSAVQAPYALATPVVECVEDALQDDQIALAESAVAHIIAERQRLIREISAFGFVKRVWPSDANFFLIEVEDAGKVLECCQEQHILLRYFGGALASCIRVSVGSTDENDRLLHALGMLQGTGA